jgi:hypothetical protein
MTSQQEGVDALIELPVAEIAVLEQPVDTPVDRRDISIQAARDEITDLSHGRMIVAETPAGEPVYPY